MKQKKAYKYRFYPSDRQKHILAQTFGCCRYVYNWALRQRTDAYYQHGERLYYEGTAHRLVTLRSKKRRYGLMRFLLFRCNKPSGILIKLFATSSKDVLTI